MSSKMLIDASHPEETRVVVLKGNRVEEFDFESANKKQLRGNIYLAKVTRVEPSLQAAFVEYGGNRHGFLAFSEIHPDYYQIPFADRQALLEEEARAQRDEDDDGRPSERADRGPRGSGEKSERSDRGERGERNHRRSRRHRRDGAVSAMERRGPADDSLSEPAFEPADLAQVAEREGPDDIEAVAPPVFGEAAEIADAEPDIGEGSDDAPDPLGSEPVQADLGLAAVDDASPGPHGGADAARTDAFAPPEADPILPEPAGLGADPSQEQAELDLQGAESRETEALDTADADVNEPAAGSSSPDEPLSPADPDEPADVVDGEAEPSEASSFHEQEETSARDVDIDETRAAEPEEEVVEQIGGDALEDVTPRPTRLRRHYKIQEVIKRRQILLIQVVKEERGNKGAALTTYLSLAGRYSVLMPNTARGGGISRKITDGEDRKRLKAIAQDLDVPEGMGVILRTAGAARSKIEVRRDFEYLLRMWESVRELTLKSTAPTLVYEEGSLIKRSIRDLYGSEVDEIIVAGNEGFGEARDFMRMLMPDNTAAVQFYRDPQPIFAKSGVEAQLDAMFSNHVTLRSGGYLVINQTEALVAIDVNSGRSTREHNIEDTALRTNLEAADEVARQLRLRDLAGLIVVDFIDMEETRNNRAVERRIKEALRFDRARIQIGRISHFGLLEMSRQRIRTGVLEGSTVICSHCAGAGTVRSTASIALHVLRLLEDALIKDASYDLVLRVRSEVALYVLNQKRVKLVELEQRFGVTLIVSADPSLTGMVYHAIERGEPATPPLVPAPRRDLVRVDSVAPIFDRDTDDGEAAQPEAVELDDVDLADEGEATTDEASAAATEGGRRRKRRRRRRGRERDGASEISADAPQPSDEGLATMARIGGDLIPAREDDAEPTPPVAEEATAETADLAPELALTGDPDGATPIEVEQDEAIAPEPVVEPAPRRRRSRRTPVRAETSDPSSEDAATNDTTPEDAAPAPRRRRGPRSRPAETVVVAMETLEPESGAAEAATAASDGRPSAGRDVGADTAEHHAPLSETEAQTVFAAPAQADPSASSSDEPAPVEAEAVDVEPSRPKRSGWWQRAKATFGS